MTRDRMPGPWRRLARERSRLVAVGLLAITALASSGLQAGAVAALRATLDGNWRGAYDILVTPLDAQAPVDGLLPPNALGSGGGGLSLDDVDRVAAVSGVEIAAPIGEILVPNLSWNMPRIVVPVEVAGVDQAPHAYRISVDYTTDDGLGERVVAAQELAVVLDASHAEPPPLTLEECFGAGGTTYEFNDYVVDSTEYPALAQLSCLRQSPNGSFEDLGGGNWQGSGAIADGYLEIALNESPQTVSRITLIDPEAERALLGERGAFLDPLVELSPDAQTDTTAMNDWAREADDDYAEAFLADQARAVGALDQYDGAALEDLRRLYAANGDDWDAWIAEQFEGQPYLPLIVADAGQAPLALRVTIEDFGVVERTPADPETGLSSGFPFTMPDELASGGAGTIVGTSVADISDVLNPFVDSSAAVAWPGADLSALEVVTDFETLGVMASGRAVSAPYTVTDEGVLLEAEGYRAPGYPFNGMPEYFALDADPARPGVESAYAGFGRTSSRDTSIAAVPIAGFSTAAIEGGEDAADFVPLGAYDVVSATLTDGDHAGTELASSVTGLGLVSPRTTAIGSLASIAQWGDDAPVSAIRVRVGDIDVYSPSAQARVVEVAAAIQELGFRATVVAGSSPSPQSVRVLDYAFGSLDGSPQVVGELGTIEQNWSELGAAARAELALSGASIAGLVVALGAAVVLLGAVQVAGIPQRRTQSAALREIGFTRRRIARWYLAEELPVLGGLALAAILAVVLSGASRLSLQVVGIASGAAVVLSAIAVVRGSLPPRPARVRRRRGAGRGAATVAAFGARQVAIHPLAAGLHFAGIAFVGLAGGALVAALLRGREASGQSILARLLSDQLLVPGIALGVVGVVAGIALVVLVRRIDLRRRASQWESLRNAGWTSGQIRLAQRVEGMLVVIPAVLVASTGAWLGAGWLAPEVEPVVVTTVTAVCAVATAIVSVTVRAEGRRR